MLIIVRWSERKRGVVPPWDEGLGRGLRLLRSYHLWDRDAGGYGLARVGFCRLGSGMELRYWRKGVLALTTWDVQTHSAL